jgi:transposase-like protein
MLSKVTLETALNAELDEPRDREVIFETQLVRKYQTRFKSMNDKNLGLYAKGMTT